MNNGFLDWIAMVSRITKHVTFRSRFTLFSANEQQICFNINHVKRLHCMFVDDLCFCQWIIVLASMTYILLSMTCIVRSMTSIFYVDDLHIFCSITRIFWPITCIFLVEGLDFLVGCFHFLLMTSNFFFTNV